MTPRLARLLLRAYPLRWRQRYGPEYAALLEEVPTVPGAIVDVLAAGAGERLRSTQPLPAFAGSGGPRMTFDLGGWHARTFAWLALLIAAPTALALGISALAYNLNISALAAIMDNARPALDNRLLGLYLMAGPALAFLVALFPVLRVSVGREADEVIFSFAIRGRVLNLIALGVSLLLVGFWVGHNLAEYVFGT
jgi:hypothetical protein